MAPPLNPSYSPDPLFQHPLGRRSSHFRARHAVPPGGGPSGLSLAVDCWPSLTATQSPPRRAAWRRPVWLVVGRQLLAVADRNSVSATPCRLAASRLACRWPAHQLLIRPLL